MDGFAVCRSLYSLAVDQLRRVTYQSVTLEPHPCAAKRKAVWPFAL